MRTQLNSSYGLFTIGESNFFYYDIHDWYSDNSETDSLDYMEKEEDFAGSIAKSEEYSMCVPRELLE